MNNTWMRLTGTAIVAAGLLLGQAPPNVKARQDRQDARIEEGKKSGELTNKIRRDRKDGGGLTPRERAKIQKAQNKQSRDIARQKHDAQKK